MFFIEMFSKIKKIFALLTIACTFNSCLGNEGKDKHLHHIDIPIEAMEAVSSESSSDLKEEKPTPPWRLWRPWKFWQWGRSLIREGFSSSGDMVRSASRRLHNRDTRYYHEDQSKRKALKQDKSKVSRENRVASSPRSQSYCTIPACENNNKIKRERGSTQREIVAQFFDSMLENIVCCWNIDDIMENDEESKKSETRSDTSVAPSATTSSTNIKTIVAKPSSPIKSQSKFESNSQTAESQQESSLSLSIVKGMIHFLNDNIYEGDLFRSRMHGEGCFQWADGTIYRGQFRDNHITGTGIIEFKDNTWYEGEFLNNVRHGRGLYVDSGRQRSYFGHWSGGAKHLNGVMHYTKTFQNSYDGEWCNNVRNGSGLRRYCPRSGYDGDWNNNIREGNGLMIWPNSDMYEGEWKNDLMCGDGKYIWNSFNNDSMSLPAFCVYRGNWEGGLRNGQGVVDFGFGMGSCYRGIFKNNRKNGSGHLVTNNGLIIQDILFVDDNISTIKYYNDRDITYDTTNASENKTLLDMCNELELEYHIHETFQTFNEFRDNKIIIEYLAVNYNLVKENVDDTINNNVVTDLSDLMDFETNSLRKALMYYQTQLKQIYKLYATVCNEKEIDFAPVLIRLYLWQMYYDCKIHHKGLTLYEIDELLSRNKKSQTNNPHDPFENIYFWQFLHSLISVATHIYAKKYIKNRKPNNVLASAFRQFIEVDILPRVGEKRGKLANGYGRVIPLKSIYKIYLDIDNPRSVRTFICKVHQKGLHNETNSSHTPKIFEGSNAYIFDDEVAFIFDNVYPYVLDLDMGVKEWDLSCFNNVSPKAIIGIFSRILPRIVEAKKIIVLETKLTFFEFFEAFIALAEESIRLEEIANYNLAE